MAPAHSGPTVERALRRIRHTQTQLIIEQRFELRCDQVRSLVDEEADSRIVEASVAAHLADADVAVPIRDGTVGGVGLESDALEPVDGRHDDGYRGSRL